MRRINALYLFIWMFSVPCAVAAEIETLHLSPNYVYRLTCQGRLLVSAVGNDTLLRLEALPKEIGCGALVKPTGASGSTDLILETTTGTILRRIEVSASGGRSEPLEINLSSPGGLK